MAACERFIELISAAVDGECSDTEKAELFEHIAACEECKELYNDMMRLSENAKLLAVSAPESFKDGTMFRVTSLAKPRRFAWGRFTAIAAACVLIAFAAVETDFFRAVTPDRMMRSPDEATMYIGDLTAGSDESIPEAGSNGAAGENGAPQANGANDAFMGNEPVKGTASVMPEIPFDRQFSLIVVAHSLPMELAGYDTVTEDGGVYMILPSDVLWKFIEAHGDEYDVYTLGEGISSEETEALLIIEG